MIGCVEAFKKYSHCDSVVYLLTRSSCAVRLGVLIGACGTPGSRPGLDGNGSRGKPLQISFKSDILLDFPSTTTVEQQTEMWGPKKNLYCWRFDAITPHRCVLWLSCPSMIHQWQLAARKTCLVIIDRVLLKKKNMTRELCPLMLQQVKQNQLHSLWTSQLPGLLSSWQ